MHQFKLYRFDHINILMLVLCAVIIYLFFPVAGQIDQYLSRPWIGLNGQYAYEDNWYLVHIGHQGLKYLVIMIAVIHLMLLIYFKISNSHHHIQRICIFVLVSMICSVSIIAVLKATSPHACPWSMVEQVNGMVDWGRVLRGQGKCLPGGHASGGFALLTLFFAYRQDFPRYAIYGLVFALCLGAMMSLIQMIRGAHFLSHNLWSFWWSWCIDFVIYKAFSVYWTQKNSIEN